jgi:predicted RNA-binding protein YlxR (DUF448 family)
MKMKTRKIPLRKCVACQQMMPKKELLRIVKTPEDLIWIDPKGKMSGRGAYLCGKINCFKLARKSKALDRALKSSIPSEVYEQLEEQFLRIEHEPNSSKEVIKTD